MQGSQRPSLCHIPPFVSSAGEEAVELAAMAGLHLDPWQQFVVANSLGEKANGKWSAFEVAVEVARQNGKGGILEARELVGLFLLGERLIIHSAHEFPTSLEAFRRLLQLIEETPDFDQRVQRVSRSHGEEGIELKGGQRIRFRTRTKGGGRGFSGDLLVLDEAMKIPEAMHGALLPTLSARPNPQVWYTGSAVDQESMDDGRVFARVRERAVRGEDDSLAYFGFSGADVDSPDLVTEEMASDPEVWARANPGLGIRISLEHIARERNAMDPRTFAVERLGVGDWPSPDGAASVIDLEAWGALADESSRRVGPVCFAFDVKPDRSAACISAAGKRSDGLAHAETVDRRPGTGWLVERLVELHKAHRPREIVCAAGSPAMSLVQKLEDAGITVRVMDTQEQAQACGDFYDLVEQSGLRHLGSPEMTAALKGAATRPLGEAWAWSRKASSIDISPLVAMTLALRASSTAPFRSMYDDPEAIV